MVLLGNCYTNSSIICAARIAISNRVPSATCCAILWNPVVDCRNAFLNKKASFNKKKKEVLPVKKISKGVS